MNGVTRACCSKCRSFPSHALIHNPFIVVFAAFRTGRDCVRCNLFWVTFSRNPYDKRTRYFTE